MIIEDAQYYKEQVIALLENARLPVADLPQSLDNFLVAIINNKIVGVAGIEIYGNYALLRSVAVDANHQGLGIASKLLEGILSLGSVNKLSDVYLLTQTASEYFKNKGFIQVSREEVPVEIQRSSEFSAVCPVSAIVMKKHILFI